MLDEKKLASKLAETHLRITDTDISAAIEVICTEMINTLADGGEVNLRNFATIKTHRVAERRTVQPRTLKPMTVPPMTKVSVRTRPVFRRRINYDLLLQQQAQKKAKERVRVEKPSS